VAELADALDLGSSARKGVGVQVSPSAPTKTYERFDHRFKHRDQACRSGFVDEVLPSSTTIERTANSLGQAAASDLEQHFVFVVSVSPLIF
jgi:hypothetical protein